MALLMARYYLLLLACYCLTGFQCACPNIGISAVLSDNTTWPTGVTFRAGQTVSLDFPLLLDQETPPLSGMNIVQGGRLVFCPAAHTAKLVTNFVKIEDGGSLEIGSEDCPFVGQAEILLTGKRGSYNSMDGEKFISVHHGGKLEIHGEQKKAWSKLRETVVRGDGKKSIYLVDNVSSWKKGDKLVLASTDFDLNQADIVTVEACTNNTCYVKGLIKFDHFGETDSGVDMQGEVGLLSRNILVHGEMEKSCYGDHLVNGEPLCDHFNFDTFGGHILAREGFASFKVEHAEFTNLGQQGIIGRYPLHWHMADYVHPNSSYVRNNSIHHTLQRCVTCHGSFGCVIQDNVAFESLGHCYFMEDGVEKGTVMSGNLGLNTRKAKMLPSDADPATFWITHPESFITNNTAGGSEGKGFWFLQASLPTGLSGQLQKLKRKHFFNKNEAFHSKIGNISGNTVHSSVFGFFFDSVLQPDQSAKGSGKYSPKKDPTNSKSEDITTNVDDITCYKTQRTCVWMILPHGHYSNLKISDSFEGMFVKKESFIDNSLFVGQSKNNFGSPNKWVNKKFWYRSLSVSRETFGIRTYVHPVHIKNTMFSSFKDSDAQTSHAMSARSVSFKSIFTGVSNLTFNNTPFSNRFLEKPKAPREFIFKDYTGSLTGIPDSYLVRNFPHLTSDKCKDFPEWGKVSACPHKYVSLLLGRSKTEAKIMRTDRPEAVYTPKKNNAILSVDHTYIISSRGNFPFRTNRRKQKFTDLFIGGVDQGDNFVLGVCVPMDSKVTVSKHSEVRSFDQIGNDTSGSVYFHDDSAGVLYIKFTGTYERGLEDIDPCGKDRAACLAKVRSF